MPETGQDEYCENCGRVMVLKRGRFGQFMACTGYPDCKTTRRLDQGKRVPDVPLEELCPKCSRNLVLRHGRYGEFVSCSGYPDCKYIKQNFIGVKCPQCADGELVEKKARRGATRSMAARIIPSANSRRPTSRWLKSARSAAARTCWKSI